MIEFARMTELLGFAGMTGLLGFAGMTRDDGSARITDLRLHALAVIPE